MGGRGIAPGRIPRSLRERGMNKESVIGELLVRSKVVDASGIGRATLAQAGTSMSLAQALVSLGLATEEDISAAIAKGLNLEYMGSSLPEVAPETARILPADFCRQRMVAPLSVAGRVLRLAIADPLDYYTIQDVEFRSRKQVAAVVTEPSRVEALLEMMYGARERSEFPSELGDNELNAMEAEGKYPETDLSDKAAVAENASLPPIVRLVTQMMGRAMKSGASDIHVEPQQNYLLVRDRVDGNLHELMRIPKGMQDAVISRLKIMAGMDIADRRRPQDGRSRLRYEGKQIDLRVSTLPTQYGEKVVMRILDSSKSQIPMEELGLTPENLRILQSLVSLPQGMILVTGPTGSGKTSTLYTALNWVKSTANNVITVEDPIEYRLPGINQVQINTKAGVTFAAGLRSILRQDPNIIMVGEIRDQETANIAVEASQTGHLLLSTLHTNNAPATITRLIDLGIEPYMVASSVVGILAQRLVRRTCLKCAQPTEPSPEIIKRLGGASRLPASGRWLEGKGCEQCGESGYKGRLAIHELLAMDDELRDLITRKAPEHRIRETARRNGMRTLLEDGIGKAAQGLTTLEEVLQAVSAEEGGSSDFSPAGGAGMASPRQPISPAEPADAGGEPAGVAESRCVLVVEDSPTIQAVVKYFLELEGYRVLVASDGEEGLAVALREKPDVVVSDVHMTGMDGPTLIRELRGRPETQNMPILVLTSEDDVDTEERCLALGANDYIVKPVEPRRLVARVKALLARTKNNPVIHLAL